MDIQKTILMLATQLFSMESICHMGWVGVSLADCPALYSVFVYFIWQTINKYQKCKSVELGDQLGFLWQKLL